MAHGSLSIVEGTVPTVEEAAAPAGYTGGYSPFIHGPHIHIKYMLWLLLLWPCGGGGGAVELVGGGPSP